MADVIQRIIFSDEPIKRLDDMIDRAERLSQEARKVEDEFDKMNKTTSKGFEALNKRVDQGFKGLNKVVGALKAIGAGAILLRGAENAFDRIAESSQRVSDRQAEFKGKLDEVFFQVGQKLGPVFDAFFDLAVNGLDKVLGFLDKMNKSVGVDLAAALKATAATVRAYFTNYAKFVKIAANGTVILGKQIGKALTFNADKKDRLTTEIESLKTKNKELIGGIENLGKVFKTTFSESRKKAQELADKGIFAVRKQTEEASKAANKLQKDYEKLIDKLQDRVLQSELLQLSPVERAERELQLALQEIDALEQALNAKAKALGIVEDFSPEFNEIRAQALSEGQRAIDTAGQFSPLEGLRTNNIFGKDPAGDQRFILESLTADPKRTEKFIQDEVFPSIEKAVKNTAKRQNPFEKLKEKMLKAFNIEEEDFDVAVGAILQSLKTFDQLIQDSVNQQIEDNNRYIDSLKERAQAVEDELKHELKLQEDGYANNVASKMAELEQIRKEEEKAARKKEELDKKKARRQLIQDNIAQASSLATAGAHFFAAESGKGLLGVAFALSAIALMFKVFSSVKKQASQATRAYKGGAMGKLVSGWVNKDNGRTDKFGGRGHAIEDSNLIVGGEEFIVNGATAHAQSDFLEQMNTGKYDGIDLAKAFRRSTVGEHIKDTNERFSDLNQRVVEARRAREENLTKTAMKEMLDHHSKKLINYFKKERPIIIPMTEGTMGYKKIVEGKTENISLHNDKSLREILEKIASKV